MQKPFRTGVLTGAIKGGDDRTGGGVEGVGHLGPCAGQEEGGGSFLEAAAR